MISIAEVVGPCISMYQLKISSISLVVVEVDVERVAGPCISIARVTYPVVNIPVAASWSDLAKAVVKSRKFVNS